MAIELKCGADVAALLTSDVKEWCAMSCPTTGVRFDLRMLALMDTDHDGRIRIPEVMSAIRFLQDHKVGLDTLFRRDEADVRRLEELAAAQADLAKSKPSAEEAKALADWEKRGGTLPVAVCGSDTAAAEAALKAVEPAVDAFFTPPEDMPLVTDEPDKTLPLADHLNPKHLEAILTFAEKCVKPVCGVGLTALTRLDYKKVKAAFQPYRDWMAAKPVIGASAKAALDDEERVVRYRLGLLEFLENFVNMKRLWTRDGLAIYQTGMLKIDGREMTLCFHVDSEAAHAPLAAKSLCCIVYVKLRRPAEAAERSVCGVITAGTVAGLYVGRNGVFMDRDGKDWEAVVTKVVEAQVSLAEAFWSPWRKLGEGIASTVKKFFGDREASVNAKLAAGSQNMQAGSAALASSVAAVGIGIGMLGAAAASLLAAVRGMSMRQALLSVLAALMVVSLPSVVLTWFKLRRRDIGAILNACGWAVNRPLRFSMRRARDFTRGVRSRVVCVLLTSLLVGAVAIGAVSWYHYATRDRCTKCCPKTSVQTTNEVIHAQK